MKKIYIVFALLLSFTCFAQQPFITTWQVGGTFATTKIVIPTNSNLVYNYTVDFGDGVILNNVTGNATHYYSSAGLYAVTISGIFPAIVFDSYYSYNIDQSEKKIQSVEQWGDIQWQTMQGAFRDCSNLVINAADSPDLSQVTNMSNMFDGATMLNQPLNNWDVSNVTYMSYLFHNAWSFNQPLSNWNVSNVTDMWGTFSTAIAFNQPIGNWDVSNVTDMSYMFSSADDFNQPVGDWNVSNVTNMNHMFSYADAFNQPLDKWDVSQVADMSVMFNLTDSFNQFINGWNVSNVTDMTAMFASAHVFNQPLNDWDVSSVTSMVDMFYDTPNFNQPLDGWFFNTATLGFSGFLSGSGLDVANYDALLVSLTQQNLTGKPFGAEGLTYCNTWAHNYLISSSLFNIVGDALNENCVLDVPDTFAKEQVFVYPVPAEKYITINSAEAISKVEIYDMMGKLLLELNNPGEQLDVSGLASGSYSLKVTMGEGVETKKFIKI